MLHVFDEYRTTLGLGKKMLCYTALYYLFGTIFGDFGRCFTTI